ncbi:MAG: nuclear transport factor 2 family protein [Anaerolineaceae bacterium]|nr:nuclear transport factor 2 family protein [Anaerolineaceae bacterium]
MTPIRMSKIESAMRIVLVYQEAFNRHDSTALTQLIHDDCKIESWHPAPDGSVHSGKEAITKYWQNLFSTLAEVRIEIEEIFGMGDRCVMRCKYHWLDEAENEMYLRAVDIFKVRDELICEKFSYVKGD